jgi:chorismate mutase-like protein
MSALLIAVVVGGLAGCGAGSPAVSNSGSSSSSQSASMRTLVDAISARLVAGKDVAAYKLEHGLPISDPTREKQVLKDAADAAAKNGVDTSYADHVISDQIVASKDVQEGFQREWSNDPGGAPKVASLDPARATISKTTTAIVAGLGGAVSCPLQQATVASVSEGLRRAGLDSATSNDAAKIATRSLCDS